jgi:uncharacterized membrane protein YkvA (DUF1232 family)
MFFKRRKHKLPKFPPEVRPAFYGLCELLNNEQILSLREAVENNFSELYAEAIDNDYIDIEVARLFHKKCVLLLNKYQEFSDSKKKLIIGAVRYIAIAEDPFDETIFASGYHDDKLVLNHVLEEIEMEEHCVPINE